MNGRISRLLKKEVTAGHPYKQLKKEYKTHTQNPVFKTSRRSKRQVQVIVDIINRKPSIKPAKFIK